MKTKAFEFTINNLDFSINSEEESSATLLGCATQPKQTVSIPSVVEHNGVSYSVTTIGSCAFWGCNTLTGCLTIPSTVTTIDDCAFWGCSGLTTLQLPASILHIGSRAFNECSGLLGSLDLPAMLTDIGRKAFWNCNQLTGTLILPPSLTSIGKEAFAGCRLHTVISYRAIPLPIAPSTFDTAHSPLLKVPIGSQKHYREAEGWKEFERIEESDNSTLTPIDQADSFELID